jgi:hypothetical protein
VQDRDAITDRVCDHDAPSGAPSKTKTPVAGLRLGVVVVVVAVAFLRLPLCENPGFLMAVVFRPRLLPADAQPPRPVA